ncbi:hypothetical protein [Polycladidibacter hongkongensis]|uniref:hypothetical protein n=1 Tax=Polycladidibacter hongkongensis TaxID=1647556 RepID=UPI00082CAF40|nr:hypothetical protein [Pseudovibrio hongkongensis]
MSLLKGWRTRLAALSLFLLGLLEAVDPHLLVTLLGEEARSGVLLFYAVAFYGLRQITSTPAGRSGEPPR